MIRFSHVNVVFFSLLITLQTMAEVSYVDILKSITPKKNSIVSEIPKIEDLLQVNSIAAAQNILQNRIVEVDPKKGTLTENQVWSLVHKRVLTLVVVPGVLGEFIDVRAFEEVFSRPSVAQKQWEELSKKHNTTDVRFNLETMSNKTEKLSDLINVASIDDTNGKPMVKIVILKTILGSLESVGRNAEQAAKFNRRLQKYVNLTDDKNIILLGYSRGTPLALEMITQGVKTKLPYISRVKALVSYAGVVAGSALADVTDDPKSSSGILLAAVKKMQNNLQYANDLVDRIPKRINNTAAVTELGLTIAMNTPLNLEAILSNVQTGDFRSIAQLIAKVATELGAKDAFGFNEHVIRTKHFITEVLKAVDELKSKNRTDWWRANTLPKNIQYRSLVAAMVDPKNSEIEKSIYESKEGYSDSLDDKGLVENVRAYKTITGIALNDSQVAVHQSLFLPRVITNLNPNNAGLDIKPMGVLQTHHWGVALQVVNKMNDGRLNPFPREKVLLSIAAYLNQ